MFVIAYLVLLSHGRDLKESAIIIQEHTFVQVIPLVLHLIFLHVSISCLVASLSHSFNDKSAQLYKLNLDYWFGCVAIIFQCIQALITVLLELLITILYRVLSVSCCYNIT